MATAIPVPPPDSGRRAAENVRAVTAAGPERRETGEGRRGGAPIVHSQVRRVREEDLRMGDGAGEGLCGPRAGAAEQLGAAVDGAILCSRPWMLPCSPLGNKAAAM